MEIRPQPGPQEAFLSTSADVAIYGGSAGGGKSFALLLEPIRHVHNPQFGAVIFRRTSVQIRNEGGLWDESTELYPYAGGRGSQHNLRWTFPSGATVSFSHLEHDQDRLTWQGAQIPLICFDELTHFSETQFFYLFSRNRSMSGIRPYFRGTCNPDPDSFVFKLVEWYIDPETGLPIRERGGKIRWFVRQHDELVWGDSRQELLDRCGPCGPCEPKSFTFIPASVFDNRKLLEKDPAYIANLQALQRVDRERLLSGNWKVRPSAGLFFQRAWFEIVDAAPAGGGVIRYWDRAATKKRSDNDPDWTAGVKLLRASSGIFFILDVIRLRGSPHEVESAILNTASHDGPQVTIGIEQDPGQAGVAEASYYLRQLAGYKVKAYPATRDKQTRAKPASAQAEAGNVKLLRSRWNESFLYELENFPDGRFDDQVDAFSGSFNVLAQERKILLA